MPPSASSAARSATPALVREIADNQPDQLRIRRSLVTRLKHLDQEVVNGRALLITRIITTAAEVEGDAERDGQDPQRLAVGDFLAGAIAGMLTAPISTRRRNGTVL